MKSLLDLSCVLMLLLSLVATPTLSASKASTPRCSFDATRAVPEDVLSLCHSLPNNATRCSFWSCLVEAGCSADFTVDYLLNQEDCVLKPLVKDLLSQRKAKLLSNNRRLASARADTANITTPPPTTAVPINPNATTMPDSPCGVKTPYGGWSTRDMQLWLLQVSMDVYFNRAHEHYEENVTKRWMGMNDRVCPPGVPKYSDCSATVTWIYWTLFGEGPDFINNWSWIDGWTGSLIQQGVGVPGISGNSTSSAGLEIGDLCFYYHPMQHVAIYVGGGKVVSHGMDPVGYFPFEYAPLDYCRRYLVAP